MLTSHHGRSTLLLSDSTAYRLLFNFLTTVIRVCLPDKVRGLRFVVVGPKRAGILGRRSRRFSFIVDIATGSGQAVKPGSMESLIIGCDRQVATATHAFSGPLDCAGYDFY